MAEWTQHVSRKRNQPYWHNAITGKSRWTPPDEDEPSRKSSPRKRISLSESPKSSAGSPRGRKQDKKRDKSSPKKTQKRKATDSYTEALPSRKTSKSDSPSIHKRLSQVAEKLYKNPQSRSKKTCGSFRGSAEAQFSPGPYSSHTDSEGGEEKKKQDLPDKRYSESSVKPGAKDINLESKPIAKPIYTRKSPLVPVTLSKSHICTKFSTKISGKPKGIAEVLTVTSPSQKHGIGGARPKTTAKVDDSSYRRSDDEKSRKSRKEKSKKSDSDDDDWYYDEDSNASKSTGGSVHVHKLKNKNDKTPVKEHLSFKVKSPPKFRGLENRTAFSRILKEKEKKLSPGESKRSKSSSCAASDASDPPWIAKKDEWSPSSPSGSSDSYEPPWIQKRRRSLDRKNHQEDTPPPGSSKDRSLSHDTETVQSASSTATVVSRDVRPTSFTRSLSMFSASSRDDDAVEVMDVDPQQDQIMFQDLSHVRENLKVSATEVLGSFTERLINQDAQPMDVSYYNQNVVGEQQLFVVVDTNVLMHSVKYIDELKDQRIQGVGRPVLVIPWVVIQELDALKNNRNTDQLATQTKLAAGIPVRYLNKMLEAKHRRLIGQTPKQAEEQIGGLQIQCNDDKVLHCCMQWKKLHPQAQVVLLTLDKNLQNKALISDIPAYDQESLRQWLLKESQLRTRTSSISPSGDTEVMLPKKKDMEPVLVDDLSCELKSHLRDSLTPVLKKEMETIYGSQWMDIVFRKPPWTLDDVLASINKHWIAVFSFILENSRDLKPHLDDLFNHYKPGSGYGKNLRKMSLLIRDGLTFLRSLRQHDSYDGQLDGAIGRLAHLERLAVNVLNRERPVMDLATLEGNLDNTGSAPSQAADPSAPAGSQAAVHQVVLNNFQYAWEIILYSKDGIISNLNSSSPGGCRRREALEQFKTTLGVVSPVYEAYRALIHSSIPDPSAFNNLAESLQRLATLKAIEPWQPWSGEWIYNFYLFSDNNRNTLKNGYDQLYSFMDEFHKCWQNLNPEEQAMVQP